MKISEIIDRRTPDWRQLEKDLTWIKSRRASRLDPERLAAFARRYRSACSDLALALALKFPETTTEYLHKLVGQAHTQLYRSESFHVGAWLRSLFVDIPGQILRDPCVWIALFTFWSLFLGAMIAAYLRPEFAVAVAGEAKLASIEKMYATPLWEQIGAESEGFASSRAEATGGYVFHNAGIGLKCFTSGIFLGVGSLITLAFNAILLGTVFGYMFQSTSQVNFSEFVTAHGPFELTAIVLSAGAGLRLGWSLIDTQGWGRAESLRRSAPRALQTAGVATILFIFAAYIEGFISPSALPYESKAAVAVITTILLLLYFFVLGNWNRRRRTHALR